MHSEGLKGACDLRSLAFMRQPVLEISAQLAQLEDVRLPRPCMHPIGRQQKEHPGFALVGREVPAALGGAHDQVHQSRVCQDAHEGTLRDLEEAAVGFEEGEAHAKAVRRDRAA